MSNLQMLHLPLSNDGETMRSVVVYAPLPLTETEWAQLHKVLRKMKPAIVSPDAHPTEGASDERVR